MDKLKIRFLLVLTLYKFVLHNVNLWSSNSRLVLNIAVMGVITEYPATNVFGLTMHLFLKNNQCVGINYWPLQGIL